MKIENNILILQNSQNTKNNLNLQKNEKHSAKSNENRTTNIEVYEKTTETGENLSNYSYVADKNEVNRLIKESEDKTAAFIKMLEKLVYNQAAKNVSAQLGDNIDSEYNKILSDVMNNNVNVEIDDETRSNAKELIDDNGYYGVKQTSERILNFAKAISGGDTSKIDLLKKAAEEGFKRAEEAWGGKLPQISQDTYAAIMAGFDNWAAASNS